MGKREFKLKFIYFRERNSGFRNMKILETFLKRHYKLTDDEVNDLKIKIVNYQVARYGETLSRTDRKGIKDKCVK